MPAPKGNTNACKRNREYHDSLIRSLKQYESKDVPRGHALRKITDRLVELGLKGEPWAIKEIANRIDGRPTPSYNQSESVSDLVLISWDKNN